MVSRPCIRSRMYSVDPIILRMRNVLCPAGCVAHQSGGGILVRTAGHLHAVSYPSGRLTWRSNGIVSMARQWSSSQVLAGANFRCNIRGHDEVTASDECERWRRADQV